MRTVVILIGSACMLAGPLRAQEWGRVTSVTPLFDTVWVERQVCEPLPPASQGRTSGAGALVGAIAGGAIGQSIGQGSGRAAATALGIVGGAVIGNRLEAPGAGHSANPTHCRVFREPVQQVTGYDVRYEYAGRTHRATMSTDPGPWVQLQVTPIGAAVPAPPPVPRVYQALPEPAAVTTVIETRTVFVPVGPVWVHPPPRHLHPPVIPYPGHPPGPIRRRHHGEPWR